MIIVSDTSPISNLLRIGQLPLLQALYGSVVIPDSVYKELRALESFGVDTSWLGNTEWIAIQTVGNKALAESLKDELDPSEAEAIALANRNPEPRQCGLASPH